MEENKASRAFLITSVALGVLAMILSFAFLQSKAGSDAAPPISIMVTSHDVRANTAIDPDKDLKEIKVQANLGDFSARALKPLDTQGYKGLRINRDIPAGSPVMLGDFVAASLPVLTGDERAIAIPVRGANALPGLLSPGDYVKLLVTRPLLRPRLPTDAGGGGGGGQQYEAVAVILEPVKVLAVGSHLTKPPNLTFQDQYEQASRSDTTQSVTLEVTEAQAITIEEQIAGGQLPVTLVLCPGPAAAPAPAPAPAGK